MESNTGQTREFSAAVLDAIRRGRKIEAIKLLREEGALGLKEAKDEVDAYMRNHPQHANPTGSHSETGIWRALAPVAIAAIAYVIYRAFV